MDSNELSYEEKDTCAWLIMNRPRVLNALSKEMFQGLRLALEKAAKTKKVRFIAITGTGNSFSAGLDIKQVSSFATRTEARNFVYKMVKPFWDQLFHCDKPVISAVNGPAYGAGAEIALASDIVVASTKSKFAFSGGRVGALCCISGVIGPMLMNGRRLVEMNLTGNPFSAEEAHEAGLVTRVAPEELLMDTVTDMLRDLDKVSPISNSSFKRIRRETIQPNVLKLAYQELFRTITSPDFKKGATAFAAKQPPKF